MSHFLWFTVYSDSLTGVVMNCNREPFILTTMIVKVYNNFARKWLYNLDFSVSLTWLQSDEHALSVHYCVRCVFEQHIWV